jgi:hypothetical protein
VIAGPVLRSAAPPANVQIVVREVLSQRQFRVPVIPAHRTLWEMFWDWVRGVWSRLTDALSAHVHLSNGTAVVLGDAIAAALMLIVIIVAVRLLLGVLRDRRQRGEHWQALHSSGDPDDLYDLSLAAARRGDYARAIALLFGAAVLTIGGAGAMRADPSRTVNEWRRVARARNAALGALFDVLARRLTQAMYAERPVSAAQWDEAADAYMSLMRVAP